MMNSVSERQRHMIDVIAAEARSCAQWVGRAAIDSRVMAAMAEVPRHEFVPVELQHAAYDNGPLPIGHGQTISQPYIVALMTDLLEPRASDVILEVGTGSGYQAAVLSRLVSKVYSLEIVDVLARQARERLRRLHYDNVEVLSGDGCLGLSEHAPFDGVIVTAAPAVVPSAWLDQLRPNAKLVIPVGGRYTGQQLRVIHKDEDGVVHSRSVLPVAFVPLVDVPESVVAVGEERIDDVS